MDAKEDVEETKEDVDVKADIGDVEEAEQLDATSALRVDDDAAAELDGIDSLDDYEWISEDEVEPGVIQKTPVFVEIASHIATGFLVGAFITLCLFSTHRRTILMSVT